MAVKFSGTRDLGSCTIQGQANRSGSTAHAAHGRATRDGRRAPQRIRSGGGMVTFGVTGRASSQQTILARHMGPTARIVDFFDRGRRAQPPISLVAKERIEKVKVSEGHLYWPTFQGLHPPHPVLMPGHTPQAAQPHRIRFRWM